MKPFDEDAAPRSDESSDDVEEEEFDIEEEITIRKRRSGRRRSKDKQYGTMASFVAWLAFLIVWLFVFAAGYGLFENIAIVFVALLVVMAMNAIVWIPSYEGGWRARTSAITGVAWLIFLIVWIIFFASGFGIYENIGIALASLLLVGALNVGMWVPSHGEEGGGRISALGGIFWLFFLVLWLPFANNFSATIYPITFNQNMAIVIASFILMTMIVIAPWFGKMQISVDGAIAIGRRPQGTLGLFWAWLIFLVAWLWVLADTFTANQNVAIVLLSLVIFCAIILGVWVPWARRRGEGPESWFSIGLVFLWVIILTVWFWFFADAFNAYQNFAVFLVSLLVIAALSGGAQWKKYRDFEAMDWDD